MKNRKIALLISTLALATLVVRCATPMGMAASNVPLQGKQIKENLGATEGSASRWGVSFLCLTDWSVPDIDLAIKRALEAKQGDALVNVRWYTKDTCALLANYSKIVVSGEAVKLEDIEQPKAKKK